jgi:hypothetical protein
MPIVCLEALTCFEVSTRFMRPSRAARRCPLSASE